MAGAISVILQKSIENYIGYLASLVASKKGIFKYMFLGCRLRI